MRGPPAVLSDDFDRFVGRHAANAAHAMEGTKASKASDAADPLSEGASDGGGGGTAARGSDTSAVDAHLSHFRRMDSHGAGLVPDAE